MKAAAQVGVGHRRAFAVEPRGKQHATASGLGRRRRLDQLGEPEPPNSRSVASIVAANTLTLFNAIIGVFFILILSLGLWADALFGLIAAVNSSSAARRNPYVPTCMYAFGSGRPSGQAATVGPRNGIGPREK